MKIFKVLLITLIPLLLSGCYTQLQYSQTMKKITDKEERKVERGYALEGEKQRADSDVTEEDYADYDEDTIPLYYKDYEYAKKYKDCACSPYNVYNFYGNDWYGYDPYYSFRSHLSLSPYYYYRWHRPYYYGPRYYSRFSISFSWGWGSPYYRYYDPFYDPFYDYYWYGHHPYAYNSRHFYDGYYYGKTDKIDRNVRYGPRSIGTNRVVNDNNRSRNTSAVTERSATGVSSKSTTRTRSVGTTRTRSSSDRNTGSSVRTRSRSDNNGSSRNRSRDNYQSVNIDQINSDQLRTVRSRTLNINDNRTTLSSDWSDIRRRLDTSERNNRPTFFERMKNFFEVNTNGIINTNRNSVFRSRSTSSSSNRATVNRNDNSNRSTVTRSNSSSSNSRSRGSSSRSRSGSSSSGSERSRGNR